MKDFIPYSLINSDPEQRTIAWYTYLESFLKMILAFLGHSPGMLQCNSFHNRPTSLECFGANISETAHNLFRMVDVITARISSRFSPQRDKYDQNQCIMTLYDHIDSTTEKFTFFCCHTEMEGSSFN